MTPFFKQKCSDKNAELLSGKCFANHESDCMIVEVFCCLGTNKSADLDVFNAKNDWSTYLLYDNGKLFA